MEVTGRHICGTLLGLVCAAAAIGAGAQCAQADSTAAPVVPAFDRATKQNTIATLRRGSALGNRPDVFAKVGDSISQSPAFLQGMGCGQWRPARFADLDSTVRLFAARPLHGDSSECGGANSFSRNSAATRDFQVSGWATEPGGSIDPACRAQESPVACEIRLDRPAYALIMFGTNDVSIALAFRDDPTPQFLVSMGLLIQSTRRLGVVPVLSTIPYRNDSPDAEAATERLNAGLQSLAATRHLPLINLWRGLAPLPDHGLYPDGLHLSVSGWPGCAQPCDPIGCAPACRAANFTPAGLQYGSDRRNLITLRTLRRLSLIEAKAGR